MTNHRSSSSFFVFLVCICLSNALVEVLSPPELAGIYQDAPMNMNPREFELTAELVLTEAFCPSSLPSLNLTGKIVLVRENAKCEADDVAKAILKNNPSAAGQLILCNTRSCSVLGYLEAREYGNDMSLNFPTLNFDDEDKILKYMEQPNHQPVIVHIKNTDYNPWLSLGNGPAGEFTQVFFEIFAFICLVLSLFKLYVFVKFQGFRGNVSQICLWIEALTAIMRILYMVSPLDLGIVYMPWSAGAWFVDTPNVLSLLTTLLITFYWQEIISGMGEKLTNKLITNLSKFRIPFLFVALVVVVLHVIATINSFVHFMSENANTISAVVALIVNFGMSVFFFVIGYRIVKVTNKNTKAASGERKMNRVSKFIVWAAVFMDLRILGLILYVSPAAATGRGAYLGIWWIIYFASWSLSLAKIMAFEPPADASSSFGSYFRRPNRFIRVFFERYLGWSMTQDSKSDVGMTNTEVSASNMNNSKSNAEEFSESEDV